MVGRLLGRGAKATGETGSSGAGHGMKRWASLTVTLVATAGLGVVGYTQTAGAQPKPSFSQVQAELNHLQAQQDQIGNQFDQLQGELDRAKAHLAEVKRQNAAAYNKYTQARHALQSVAVASYEDSGNSSMMGLLTAADPGTVLSQAALVQEVANLHNEQAARFLSAAQAVQKAQDQVQRTETGIQQLTEQVKGKRDHLNKLVAHEQALLQSMSGAQDAALIQAAGGISTPGQAIDPYGTGTPALKAVQFAFDHIGDPYVWGATGPSAFDCSGLIMAAYAYAGISIPRDTYSQVAALPAISESAMRPGDIMFFEGDGHEGMYVGDIGGQQMMIDAPATGQNVTLHPISEGWYASTYQSSARVPGSGA